MRLQDSDRYLERYKKNKQEYIGVHPRTSKRCNPGLSGRWGKYRVALYSFFTLILSGSAVNAFADEINSGNAATFQSSPALTYFSNPASVASIPAGMVLQTDHSGHFRGTALINNVPMPFIIDTGATQTVIPASMAIAAGLPFGKSVQAKTAGGQVFDQMTQIKSLKMGNTEIKKLDARINRHLNEVLIGMNTLKYFRMTQDGNTLTLAYAEPEGMVGMKGKTASVSPIQIADGEPLASVISDQPNRKAKSTWKKTVTCDGQNNCKTVYGDH